MTVEPSFISAILYVLGLSPDVRYDLPNQALMYFASAVERCEGLLGIEVFNAGGRVRRGGEKRPGQRIRKKVEAEFLKRKDLQGRKLQQIR